MTTLIKIFLALVAFVTFVVAAACLTFYFSSGLQKRIMLSVLRSQPGIEANVDHVRFRFSNTQIRGLKITAGPESLALASLEAQYSLGGLMGDGLKLDLLTVSGFKLDVAANGGGSFNEAFAGSGSGPVTAGTESSSSAGPIPVEIGKVRVDGTVSLPDALEVTFDLKMDNIRPGDAGALGLEVDAVATGPEAPFQMAELRMTGALNQTAKGIFDRVEGQLTARLLENHSTEWVEANLRPRFTGNTSEFTAVVEALQVSKGTTRLVDGELKATGSRADGAAWLVGYSAQLTSDLAQLSSLSIMPLAKPLSSGSLDCRISGQLVEGGEATLNGVVEVRNLRPANYAGRALSLKLEPAVVAQTGSESIEVTSPLRVVGPSTVTTGTLTTKVVPGSDGRTRFEGLVDLDQLYPEEWEPLKASFSGPQPAVKEERDPTPDEEAPWSGLEGEATVKIKRLQLREGTFEDMVATVKIEDGKTVNAQVAGRNLQTPLEAVASIRFNPTTPARPYALNGAIKVEGLDVTPFLRTPNSNSPVILEGIFNVKGNFNSTAPNLAYLADTLTGDFLLQSAGRGVFRPLGEKTSLATGISGLLGALGGGSNKVGWVQEVITQLKEIPFTQMSFRMGREENLDLFLRDLDLVSRETRIRGNGILQYKEGAPLTQFPMDLRFDLFAKGRLAEALRNGNQLRSDQPDDLGFYPGPPLPLRGSIAQPESLLINLLMESGTQLIPGLLGPGK